jgi:uncharacterized protein YqeY
MSIVDQLQQARIQAYKNKDVLIKDIIAFILSQIKNRQIELQKDLNDSDVIQLIKKEIKTRNESVVYLRSANKTEELYDEEKKIVFLQQFLPVPYTESELAQVVREAIDEMWVHDPIKEQWRIKGYVMQKYGDRTDPGMLHTIVSSLYS